MALLLSLAPCAFAEGETATGKLEIPDTVGSTEEISLTNDDYGINGGDAEVTATGHLTNNGTINASASHEATVSGNGLTNNNTINTTGGQDAIVNAGNGSLTNNSTGTITVTGGTDGAMVGADSGSLTNHGKIAADANKGCSVYSKGGDLTNTNEISVKASQTGNYADVYAEGHDLINSGTIKVQGQGSASVHAKNGSLTNSNTIEVTESGLASVFTTGDDLTNNGGTITAKSFGRAEVGVYEYKEYNTDGELISRGGGDLINNGGSITAESSNSGARVETEQGNLTNNGTIVTKGESWAVVSAAGGTLTNENEISITSEGNAMLKADGMENYGTITLEGGTVCVMKTGESAENDTSFLSDDEALKNYGTITVIEKGQTPENAVTTHYYGVNYVGEQDNITESALTSWQDGKEGNEVTLKTDYEARDGHNFFWMVNDQKYDPGQKFIVNSVTSIKALWEKIINSNPPDAGADSGHAEKSEKSGEKIVKYIDAKVLDADRREMEPEVEYYKVAKTSYNRLIVTFTWQQMADMTEGEHLFYIVEADGTETEYTLTIW